MHYELTKKAKLIVLHSLQRFSEQLYSPIVLYLIFKNLYFLSSDVQYTFTYVILNLFYIAVYLLQEYTALALSTSQKTGGKIHWILLTFLSAFSPCFEILLCFFFNHRYMLSKLGNV